MYIQDGGSRAWHYDGSDYVVTLMLQVRDLFLFSLIWQIVFFQLKFFFVLFFFSLAVFIFVCFVLYLYCIVLFFEFFQPSVEGGEFEYVKKF